MENSRDYDVVLFGATGYTGQLVAEHLLTRRQGARIALAGRNRQKLEQVRTQLDAADLPLLVGDSHDDLFVQRLARSTHVVCTTVGPYAVHGAGLVAACAHSGTSYCDLTGESQFIRAMIDAHAATAERTGARLVHSCGFDSIPSDVGTFYLQQQAREKLGGPCEQVRACVTSMKGKFSGGTFASMEHLFDEARANPALRKLMFDPYSLNPEGERRGPDGPDPMAPAYDQDFGWTAPFIMASANTRIVRRSNAVMGYAYGRDFRYSEAVATGSGAKGWALAQGIALGSAGIMATLAVPALRKLTAGLRPKPGEGPTAAERAAGSFVYELLGSRGTQQIRVKVSADLDPGYGATARMLGESALCLAQDADRLPVGGGSWTTASGLGHPLLQRLNQVGVTFAIA